MRNVQQTAHEFSKEIIKRFERNRRYSYYKKKKEIAHAVINLDHSKQ